MVVFKTPVSQINAVLSSFLNESNINDIEVNIFDNGVDSTLKDYCSMKGFNYLTLNKNIGFGSGHNFILKSTIGRAKSYLILNPDLYLTSDALNKLYIFMQSHLDCGVVSPKILNPDKTAQYVCRLLPTPIDLIARRFFSKYIKSYLYKTELRFTNYDKTCHVPFIHGACLLIDSSVYESINGFDGGYFLYMEDIDICRKISKSHRIYFYAEVTAVHSHAKGSYKSGKLLYFHITSAIHYFNKWGWFFDLPRARTNKATLNDLLFYQQPKSLE
jgi:GT2 family glycosyltransferase